eukprot:CAMPEP_0202489656 /NCGR_PEP_ID=MMETSP1361-20130828/7318_1 /ASSEMBLY_ACC=CAM_ASM_000849 /TAXON_ID=210615 /ORGANISM="Staurosira complex sp., Strain CCMP2646" /LENGTH=101 /DNA_ID=CAMNT_0049119435 /DNA_START=74 /DNA_END=379 /DNA_ORIENTATION=+
MSTAIVTKSAAKALACRALTSTPSLPTCQRHLVRVVHSSPSPSLRHQDTYSEENYYYSSFESTLERLLEMAQLGQEPAMFDNESAFQQVVRSSYFPTDYQV